MDTSNLSSNWKILQARLAAAKKHAPSTNGVKSKQPTAGTSSNKRARVEKPPAQRKTSTKSKSTAKTKTPVMDVGGEPPQTKIEKKLSVASAVNAGLSEDVEIGKFIAMDCEMVGVGENGVESALARVSIVNYNGEQVYDSYVLPKEQVVDWRTHVSGMRPEHMKRARTLKEVQQAVAGLLKDRVVVGHALRHDFRALMLDHPYKDLRDTSRYKAYKQLTGGTPKLSLLASELLGLEIQSGEHSSLEDARACMLLYKRDRDGFETTQGRVNNGRRGKKA